MQLYKSSKDFQLNKTTFVNLRLIAHLGQLLAIIIVKFYLNFEFSQYLYCLIIVGIGIVTNIFLHFQTKNNQLDNFQSTIYLAYDIIQLGLLLYLTGGVTNPFIILIIVPSVFSSKYLNLWTSIFLASLTLLILLIISFNYLELPYPEGQRLSVPDYYLFSIPLSVGIGLFFLVYFGIKFRNEYRIRKEALDNIQIEMAKEHELVSLGGQAAAAAHSLGTPLSTISLIAKELKEELGKNSKYSDDINLLVSQSNRSNEILKSLTLNPHIKDEFLKNELSLNDYLSAIISSYEEISEKKFILINKDDHSSVKFNRSLEINYGLRNFIGNANKFSNYAVEVIIKSNERFSEVIIKDDGPGFPEDIIDKLGQPYISSISNKDKSKTGLGLGTFIGITLLEKNNAKVEFKNIEKNKGALVNIVWLNENLKNI
jgi:two-component system sensor histidine kinase RegB